MAEFAIATFRCDVTPPLGHSLLGGWIPPAVAIDDTLEAIGYVLFGAGDPLVICAVDWAGLMNDAHGAWRRALATAAGTTPDRVAVQCVHQHNTPFVCPEAHAAAARYPDLPAMYDVDFFARCLERVQAAVTAAVTRRTPITHLSHGTARVENVASNRRVDRDENGVVREMRLSSCTDPRLIALPEGPIDPRLQTLAFHGPDGRRVIACHYYATHPMSFYRDGRVTSDFCGLARKRLQAEEPGCTHLYFTGCAGNISAGKFNDGSPAARVALTERMYQGMVAAGANRRLQPLTSADWRTDSVLPAPRLRPTALELEAAISDPHRPLVERLLPAYRLGWLRRFTQGTPLVLSRLRLNDLSVLHLPGEMFIEYQLRAQGMRPDKPVLVAAYGDDGIWYVPTRAEYSKGGYEVGVAFCAEEIDATLTAAIQRLLA